jgi:hypothetical protein
MAKVARNLGSDRGKAGEHIVLAQAARCPCCCGQPLHPHPHPTRTSSVPNSIKKGKSWWWPGSCSKASKAFFFASGSALGFPSVVPARAPLRVPPGKSGGVAGSGSAPTFVDAQDAVSNVLEEQLLLAGEELQPRPGGHPVTLSSLAGPARQWPGRLLPYMFANVLNLGAIAVGHRAVVALGLLLRVRCTRVPHGQGGVDGIRMRVLSREGK